MSVLFGHCQGIYSLGKNTSLEDGRAPAHSQATRSILKRMGLHILQLLADQVPQIAGAYVAVRCLPAWFAGRRVVVVCRVANSLVGSRSRQVHLVAVRVC